MILQDHLNKRKLDIFLALCEMRVKDVAQKFELEENTIYEHAKSFGMLIGTTHRGVWMKLAIEQGLVSLTVKPKKEIINGKRS